MFERYNHHGNRVWVRSDLKGRHQEHCLCWKCSKFSLERDKNCTIANLLYATDVAFKLVTPVWECESFDEKVGT